MMRGVTGLLALLGGGTALASDIQIGDTAPTFRLRDQAGIEHDLAAYQGRWVILYFYPKDDTPGCTTEACKFRDAISTILAMNAQVFGISLDDQASHASFARKYELPFPLLSDTDAAVSRQYGSLWSFGPIRFSQRHTFIIDPRGQIATIYRSVNTDRHTADVIRDLKKLQATEADRR